MRTAASFSSSTKTADHNFKKYKLILQIVSFFLRSLIKRSEYKLDVRHILPSRQLAGNLAKTKLKKIVDSQNGSNELLKTWVE